jgi:hypothetical protein
MSRSPPSSAAAGCDHDRRNLVLGGLGGNSRRYEPLTKPPGSVLTNLVHGNSLPTSVNDVWTK